MDRVRSPNTRSGDDRATPLDIAQNDRLVAQLDELTDALVAANDQLIALFQLSGHTAGSLEPAIATERVLRHARGVLGAASVTFFPEPSGEDTPITASGGDATRSAASHPGPATTPRIDRVKAGGYSRLVAPVRTSDRVFGTIVARAEAQRDFTTGDLKLLDAVANHLALILELSALHADAVAQALVQRDHDTASTLAQAALGVPLPSVPGLDTAATALPARAAGGDFFAAGATETGLYVALGDVSGKGLPAALVMTNAVWAVRVAFDRHPRGEVGAVLADVDHQLASYLAKTAMFITMAVAHVDLATSSLTITNAGQSPVLVGSGAGAVPIRPDGPPIGVLEPRHHPSTHLPFGPGALLFLGSDGCTDQRGDDDRLFGEAALYRLVERLTSQSDRSEDGRGAQQIVDGVMVAVTDHRSEREQDDDLTAIVVRNLHRQPPRPGPDGGKP
jgi:serine phosphatase RsbU (regulator of sigma subunit)